MRKELYFTPNTLGPKSAEMREACHEGGHPERQVFDPGQAALLVLDMQDYFLKPASHAFIPSAPAILPGIDCLVKAFKRQNRPVVFTQHANSPQDAGMMGLWWKDLLQAETPAWRIAPGLDSSQSFLIQKSQYDAFWGTSLEQYLIETGSRQVLITGVMTHLCCETTARSAFVRGFQVFFGLDVTATYTEAMHRASLLNLAHGFAVLTTTSQIIECIHG